MFICSSVFRQYFVEVSDDCSDIIAIRLGFAYLLNSLFSISVLFWGSCWSDHKYIIFSFVNKKYVFLSANILYYIYNHFHKTFIFILIFNLINYQCSQILLWTGKHFPCGSLSCDTLILYFFFLIVKSLRKKCFPPQRHSLICFPFYISLPLISAMFDVLASL